METLAIPFSDWLAENPTEVDTVIVGSGYGGSVAALRLAEVGKEVVVLERGAEYLPGEFPNEFGQMVKFQRLEGPSGPLGQPAGLFNWRVGSAFSSLVGNGLGGGSLINAGVAMTPQDEAVLVVKNVQPSALPSWKSSLNNALCAYATCEVMLRNTNARSQFQDVFMLMLLP